MACAGLYLHFDTSLDRETFGGVGRSHLVIFHLKMVRMRICEASLNIFKILDVL